MISEMSYIQISMIGLLAGFVLGLFPKALSALLALVALVSLLIMLL